MKYLVVLLLCFASMFGEESFLTDLAKPGGMPDFSKEEVLEGFMKGAFLGYGPQSYSTHCVYITYSCGWMVHVGEYWDGTRIETYLEGPCCGLQRVTYYGFLVCQSSYVVWMGCGFTHYYPNGTVSSYPSIQYVDFM